MTVLMPYFITQSLTIGPSLCGGQVRTLLSFLFTADPPSANNSDCSVRYGVKVGLTNYAAAYCTGLLLARRVLQR